MPFIPEEIWIQDGLGESAVAQRVRSAAPDAAVRGFDDLTALAGRLQAMPPEHAKRRLVVARRAGGFVKDFPGGRGVRPPGWHYFIPAMGCPADCRYCFLQTYHAAGAPVVFADTAAMLAEVEAAVTADPSGYFYGGELCDDLMLEPFLGVVAPLVETFRNAPDATLELRTKSDEVGPLVSVPPAASVVVSWTFSPRDVVDVLEPGTASLERRIAAAAAVQRHGFRIGLRLDPIVLEGDWRSAYRDLVERLAAALDALLVESAHLGVLRFTPALKAAVETRYGRSAPFSGPFSTGTDGKLRYSRPERTAAYVYMARLLRAWNPRMKIRLCMETPAVEADWRRLALAGAGALR